MEQFLTVLPFVIALYAACWINVKVGKHDGLLTHALYAAMGMVGPMIIGVVGLGVIAIPIAVIRSLLSI